MWWRVCGGGCMVAGVWWRVCGGGCGGGCVVAGVWWRVCGGGCADCSSLYPNMGWAHGARDALLLGDVEHRVTDRLGEELPFMAVTIYGSHHLWQSPFM
eukprot:4131325-Prymnesium_polylepis.2